MDYGGRLLLGGNSGFFAWLDVGFRGVVFTRFPIGRRNYSCEFAGAFRVGWERAELKDSDRY